MMLISGITAVLAALCSLDLAQGNMLKLEVNEFTVESFDGVIMGEWKPMLSKKNSESIIDMDMPVLEDLSTDMKLKFECSISGTDIQPFESTICDAMNDEILGKSVIQAIEPAIKDCPIKGDKYSVVQWLTSSANIPDGLPDGPLNGKVSIIQADGTPSITFKFEGNLVRDLPGKK